jgi:hypothetical protein
MRKIHLISKKYPILLLFGLNLSCFLLVILGFDNVLKVEIRQAFTTKRLETPAIFLAHPDSLPKFNFKSYKKEELNAFFKENTNSLRLHYRVNLEKSPIEKAKDIILSFSKNGGNGCGEYSSDLMKNIEWTTTGGGCCSDHSQVFIALSLLNGLYTREVNHISHTFNEFWDDSKNKWIWIDPQYCLLAKDSIGNYLSIFEIYTMAKKNLQVKWEFFGTASHEFYTKAASENRYFHLDQFQAISLLMGNRVFLQDKWNKRLKFLPKDILQSTFLLSGIQPGLVLWDEDSEYYLQLEKTRRITFALFVVYLIFNLYLGTLLYKKYLKNRE